MTNDDELGYPAEDFKSIPKDTKIFIIFDPQDMDSYAARNKTADQLKLAGFTSIHNHSVAYYGKILDGSYGINLHVGKADPDLVLHSNAVTMALLDIDTTLDYSDDRAIRKTLLSYYTHTLLLRKIRALKKQAIVLEAGVVFRSRIIDNKPHRNFIDRELLDFNFEPLVQCSNWDDRNSSPISVGYWVSPKAAQSLVRHITSYDGYFASTLDSMFHSFYYNELMKQRETTFGLEQKFDTIEPNYKMFIRED